MTRYFTCQRCGKTKARTISTYKKYMICATCTRRLREGGHKIPKTPAGVGGVNNE